MPLPWLRIIDGVLGATDLVRWVKGQPPADTRIAGESRLEFAKAQPLHATMAS